MNWWRRLMHTIRRRPLDDAIDRELRFHMAERADQFRQEGMSEDDAIRRARLQFGNPLVQRERTRDIRLAIWLDRLLLSVRATCRSLARTPTFSAVVVLTLAICLGANVAIFSVIDAVLLRPLPFPDPERLVQVSQATAVSGETPGAAIRLEEWSQLATTFDGISHWVVEDVSDTTGENPELVTRATVGPRWFDVVGIPPLIGRVFRPGEHLRGGPDIAIISERYWRTRFDADPRVLERAIRMANRSYAIVGVLPASFTLPADNVDWWVPQWSDAPWTQSRQARGYNGVGRLKAGVTLAQARGDLDRVQAQLGVQYPGSDREIEPRLTPMKDAVVAGVRASLWVLFGAVTVLMLIACSNIAALLLARSAQRRQEVAVQHALGGSRQAVVLHLLMEPAMLAVAGGAGGVAVALSVVAGFRALMPAWPRVDDVVINVPVLVYLALATVAVVVLCGFVPVFRTAAATPIAVPLAHGRGAVTARLPLLWLLVGMQVALSITLLIVAGLFGRSLDALLRVDPGFDPTRVLTFRVSASFGEERDYSKTVQRINRTLSELAALPGVEATATTPTLPGMSSASLSQEIELLENRGLESAKALVDVRAVSPGYFAALQTPIFEGDLCTDPMTAEGSNEAMVNRAFAARYGQGRSVVGMHLAGDSPDRITGIVGDVREASLDRAPVPTVYLCFGATFPQPWYLARTRGEPTAAIAAIRARLRQLEPLRSVYEIEPLESRLDQAYAQNRLRTIVLGLFAAAALSLACLGVYGTLGYVITLRRREIALRVALGASRTGILTHFLAYGGRVIGLASVAGVLMSLAFARTLSGMLYEVSSTDGVTFGAVTTVVLAVSAVAMLVPSARAALAEPANVLRAE